MKYNLIAANKNSLKILIFFKYERGIDDLFGYMPFVSFDSYILFTHSLAHNIYSFNDTSPEVIDLRIKYKIKFPYDIPLHKLRNQEINEVVKVLTEGNYFYNPYSFFEFKNLFGFTFLNKGVKKHDIYNKVTKETLLYQ